MGLSKTTGKGHKAYGVEASLPYGLTAIMVHSKLTLGCFMKQNITNCWGMYIRDVQNFIFLTIEYLP